MIKWIATRVNDEPIKITYLDNKGNPMNERTKIKADIKFWQKAKQKIKKEFSPPCKDFNLNCATCQANIYLSWLDSYIDTLEWILEPPFKKEQYAKTKKPSARPLKPA